MKIQGLQKLTLLDYPEKVACTVFTAGCNFRCPFCHNASLVTHVPSEAELSEEAFFSFLKKRQGILDGVCITGGEPLLQTDIEEFIRRIKELGYAVKVDTNGSFPEKLKRIVSEGIVDYVAMDIKNSQEGYAETIGTEEKFLEAVRESVEFLKEGHVDFEFRTTVTKNFHTAARMEEIGRWISGVEKYFLQSFVDSGDLISSDIIGCDEKEMKEFLSVVSAYVPNTKIRGI